MSLIKTSRLGFFLPALLIVSFVFSLANAAHAAGPEAVVKSTVDNLVNKIEQNRAAYKANNAALFKMVDDVLLPVIHEERISALVLGKNWRKASPEQQSAFVSEFKTFLMRSFAPAMLEYSGEKVNYLPSETLKGGDRVVVKAELVSLGGEKYPVNLYMSNRKDTRWRAYNIEVAGINFVAQYRQTFAEIVSQKGIDGLLAELRTKNANLKSS
jgi:phospholipid transport system substrate-binding protein